MRSDVVEALKRCVRDQSWEVVSAGDLADLDEVVLSSGNSFTTTVATCEEMIVIRSTFKGRTDATDVGFQWQATFSDPVHGLLAPTPGLKRAADGTLELVGTLSIRHQLRDFPRVMSDFFEASMAASQRLDGYHGQGYGAKA